MTSTKIHCHRCGRSVRENETFVIREKRFCSYTCCDAHIAMIRLNTLSLGFAPGRTDDDRQTQPAFE